MEEIMEDELICPITLERFRNPVIAGDGHIYENEAILKWIREKGTSPLTREVLKTEDIYEDRIVKEAIIQHYQGKPINLETIKKRARRDVSTLNVTQLPIPTVLNNRLETLMYVRDDRPIRNKCKNCWKFYRNRLGFPAVLCCVLVLANTPLGITLVAFSLTNKGPSDSVCTGTTGFRGQTACSIKHINSYRSKVQQTRTILAPANQYEFYLFFYHATSNVDTFVFEFSTGDPWYLDDVSVYDLLTNEQMIPSGNFENGTLNEYCVCGSASITNISNATIVHSGNYSLYIPSSLEKTRISRKVNLVDGRYYIATFWALNQQHIDRYLYVYISTTSITRISLFLPLFTTLFVIFIN